MLSLHLYNYFELLALVCSIVFWKNIRNSSFRWFVPYLIFIVAVDLYGTYNKSNNGWLYNISVPVEYIFFVFIFLRHFKKEANRKAAIGFLLVFSMYIICSLLITGASTFNFNVLVIGSFFMIVFSVLYFVELYNRPGIIHLNKERVFWVAVGVLLFNAGEFSYDMLSKFVFIEQMDRGSIIFRSINKYLNLLLYLCISISFLWKKKDTVTLNRT